MITKYFANVAVKFNPFSPGGVSARLFLSRVPSSAKLETKVLTANSKEKPEIQVTFKDKTVMTADPNTIKLAIKEAISD
ncbi:mitochondrial 54S ribosomal protein YmL44 [Scheffersomyces coipomensis]|uniref:mitochondrial 54S ribosomal protein YmL44 n=1 Tax=Scheffersomyces coipomensis TaxID=1788519 RepID=UPI00315C5502